jgi:hypothetical protein
MANSYTMYQVPSDIDERIVDLQRRLSIARGVEQRKISKAVALRHILDLAAAAEQLGVKPIAETCTQ